MRIKEQGSGRRTELKLAASTLKQAPRFHRGTFQTETAQLPLHQPSKNCFTGLFHLHGSQRINLAF
jgi:hypothetical protein